jgi:hypothetical protein
MQTFCKDPKGLLVFSFLLFVGNWGTLMKVEDLLHLSRQNDTFLIKLFRTKISSHNKLRTKLNKGGKILLIALLFLTVLF